MRRNQNSFGVIEILTVLGIVILVAFGGWWVWQNHNKKSGASINSYADCVNAGYPVQASYPSVCRTPDNKTFINPAEKNTKSPEAPNEPATGKVTYNNGTPVPADSQARAKAAGYYCPSWDAKPGEVTIHICINLDN